MNGLRNLALCVLSFWVIDLFFLLGDLPLDRLSNKPKPVLIAESPNLYEFKKGGTPGIVAKQRDIPAFLHNGGMDVRFAFWIKSLAAINAVGSYFAWDTAWFIFNVIFPSPKHVGHDGFSERFIVETLRGGRVPESAGDSKRASSSESSLAGSRRRAKYVRM
jgi:hypothetical protein